MNKRKIACVGVSGVGVAVVALVAWAGTAFGASGGGFNPNQQDCPWNSDAWNTPPNQVPTGCHDAAVNVESGGTTNGDPNSNNTRFAEFGIDQSPNNPNNPSTGIEENIGDPGTADSPHSGCLAANTDGTNGGTGVGCGNNPAGTGFESNFDYYAIYCPATGLFPAALFPGSQNIPDPTGNFGGFSTPGIYQCSAGQSFSQPSFTPDTGSANAANVILTQGLLVYVGAFDNLDNGEHDGFDGCNGSNGCQNTYTDGAINGASDGGAAVLSFTPQNATNTPSATNPEGLVNASEGECADSICSEGTTQQQTVYYGCYDPTNPQTATWTNNGVDGTTNPQNNPSDAQCTSGTPESTNVYQNNTPASTMEVFNCSGGGPASSELACLNNSDGTSNPNGANGYRSSTPQQVNAEPGIQTYQDPDPQRSPALPFGTPGTYVGTCGIYVNDSGGDGEPGATSTLTGGNAPAVDPGYVVPTGMC